MQGIKTIGMTATNATVTKNTADTANSLSDLSVTIENTAKTTPFHKDKCDYCQIYVEDNPIRFAFGASPTTSLGAKLYPGDFLELRSYQEIENIEFINAVSGNNGTLQITTGFRR